MAINATNSDAKDGTMLAQASSSSDKRHAPRYEVEMAVAFAVGERKDRVGVCIDVSVEGARFNTASHCDVGDKLDLTLIHRSASRLAACQARVVRVERAPMQSDLLWRYVAAVQFERPLREIEPVLRSAQSRRN